MSRWMDINLARPSDWRRRAAAKSLAAVAVLLLAWLVINGLRWTELRQQIADQQSLSLRPSARAQAASPSPAGTEQAKNAVAISHMLQQLATPWEALFSRTESSLPDGLKLESLQSQPEQSKMLVKVIARDFHDIFLFMRHLQAQKGLELVQLKSQSFTDSSSPPRWRATLEVQWTAGTHE